MCESRKEQSDGIAIDTKSIASSSLPVGLCRRQKGETREEGGHILDMFALCMQKKHSFRARFVKRQYLDEEQGNKNPTDRSVLSVRDHPISY